MSSRFNTHNANPWNMSTYFCLKGRMQMHFTIHALARLAGYLQGLNDLVFLKGNLRANAKAWLIQRCNAHPSLIASVFQKTPNAFGNIIENVIIICGTKGGYIKLQRAGDADAHLLPGI